ncbi:hypothetical protein GCM10008944_01310 [Cytobacillus oceanisediminis]
MTTTTTTTLYEPGLHLDVPHDVYHRGLLDDPRPLQSSMAKTLVLASPAKMKWDLENRVDKKVFDEGQATHELVLEGGLKTVDEHDFDSWRTKASQEARDASRAAGRVPLLTRELEVPRAMAKAVHSSPLAADQFTHGHSEVSLLAFDDEFGVPLQARVDWLQLPEWGAPKPKMVDLKTTARGDVPREFNREAAKLHYHLSLAFYRRVLMLLGHPEPEIVLVTVGKDAPHFPAVHELSEMDRMTGDLLVRKAIATYAECLANDYWPGYDTEVHRTSMPVWASIEADELAGLDDEIEASA